MENYALAKQKLFNMLRNNKYALINIDDSYKDKVKYIMFFIDN